MYGPMGVAVAIIVGVGLIGLASAVQSVDKISKIIGAILAGLSAIMFVFNLSANDPEVLFMLWLLVTVISGINLIRLRIWYQRCHHYLLDWWQVNLPLKSSGTPS